MHTSYFANLKNIQSPYQAVSIAGKGPDWYHGPSIVCLAPKFDFFSRYKQQLIDKEEFTSEFTRRVLKPLNPKRVWTQIHTQWGDNPVLLCYETPCAFCHRRLVASWFEQELGVEVSELHKPKGLFE